MMWHDGYQNAWVWPVLALVVVAVAGLGAWALFAWRRPPDAGDGAAEVLRRRFAAGEIDEAQYRERMAVLGAAPDGGGRPSAVLPVVVIVAVVVVVALVVALVATRPRDGWHGPMMPNGYRATTSSCAAPSLPGQTVDVTLTDMRGAGMMNGSGPGMMNGATPYGPGMMSGVRAGMMRIFADPSTVPAGQVSFRVWNAGAMVHEMVVLPLPPGGAGSRAVGADGTVNEDGSLGEASATCAAGEGDGIAPHAFGWVTLDLPAGRYELVCNLPGHYAAGMFTELDVG